MTTMTLPPVPVINGICLDCERELDHCHGTLVVHLDGVVECTDAHCLEMHVALHELVLQCDQVGTPCTCDRC
jgi:hypothetical protein